MAIKRIWTSAALFVLGCIGIGTIRAIRQYAYDEGWFKGYSEACKDNAK